MAPGPTFQRQADELVELLTRAAAGVIDAHGHLHSPDDGKFISPGGAVREALAAAKSIAELNDAATGDARRIGRADVSFDMTGSDLGIAREHAEGVLRVLDRYPDTGVLRIGVADLEGSDPNGGTPYARINGDDILFSREFASDPKAYHDSLTHAHDIGWYAPGHATPMAVAIHEAGHLTGPEWETGHRASSIGMAAARKAGRWSTSEDAEDYIAELLGRYATTGNGAELAAIGFTDVMLHGRERASELARELFDMNDAEYRKIVGLPATRAVTRAAAGVIDKEGHLHAPKGLGDLSGRFVDMDGPAGRVAGRDLTAWAKANSRKLTKAETDGDVDNTWAADYQRDYVLLGLAKEQGWDALPEVVSKGKLTRMTRSGGAVEMWRGVSGERDVQPVWEYGPDIGKPAENWHADRTPRAAHQRLREGPLQFGRGIYGNGLYFTVGHNVGNKYGNTPTGVDWIDVWQRTGKIPAEPGSVQRAALRPDAVVADYDELLARYKREKKTLPPAIRRDLGRFAAMLGIDAVRIVGKHDMDPATFQDQYLVFNRSAMVFEQMKGISDDA